MHFEQALTTFPVASDGVEVTKTTSHESAYELQPHLPPLRGVFRFLWLFNSQRNEQTNAKQNFFVGIQKIVTV